MYRPIGINDVDNCDFTESFHPSCFFNQHIEIQKSAEEEVQQQQQQQEQESLRPIDITSEVQ